MKKTRSPKMIIKIVLSHILIISGTWAITEAIYGPYLVHLNSRLAKNQSLPYKSNEIFSELSHYLIPLIFGIIAILVGIKLWGK